MQRSEWIWGKSGLVAFLPRDGCLQLTPPLVKGVAEVQLMWSWKFDPLVAIWAVAGFVLVWAWRQLRESQLLHMTICGIGSLVVIATFVMWYVLHHVRDALHNTAGAIGVASTLLFTFSTAARQVFLWLVLPTTTSELTNLLYMRDPFFNFPIGLMFALVATLSTAVIFRLGTYYGMPYFASPLDPEGEVAFRIGPEGERMDLLPPAPWAQLALGWVLWLLGLAVILVSTHSDSFSVLLAFLALAKDPLQHAAERRRMAQQAVGPERLRSLIPLGEYEKQTRRCTEAALEALQQYIKANPQTMHRVQERTEMRVRRFSEGGPHVRDLPELNLGGRGWLPWGQPGSLSCAVL
jgi:hypothetical protein